MALKNLEIRNKINESGIKYWQVAKHLGIHYGAFSVMLREELSDRKKAEVYLAIDKAIEEELEGEY